MLQDAAGYGNTGACGAHVVLSLGAEMYPSTTTQRVAQVKYSDTGPETSIHALVQQPTPGRPPSSAPGQVPPLCLKVRTGSKAALSSRDAQALCGTQAEGNVITVNVTKVTCRGCYHLRWSEPLHNQHKSWFFVTNWDGCKMRDS